MRSFNSSDFGSMLKDTISIGTSLTNVFTVPVEQAGDYYWSSKIWVVHTNTPTTFTLTPGYTGSASPIGWSSRRYTAATIATSLHSTFTATPSSLWIVGEFNGYFRAATAGDFTLGCTVAGGNATIQIASHLEIYLVE
jgi:hypothetical protein